MRDILILVLIVISLGLHTAAVAGEEPDQLACARLLVLSPGEEPAELTALSGEGEATRVDLAPLMFLFDGDNLILPAGSSAVMLCYSDATRQTHHGPSVIEIGTDGLVVTEPAAIPPVVEELPLALEPVAVTGRTDIRGATMYTRGDGDNCLEQAYPVETTVMPGALQCEWVVSGLAGEVTVTLADDDYQVVDTQVLAAETEGAELAVDAGKHYYWRIWHPDIATSYAGFTVLDDGSRDAVAAVLASMGAEALGTGDAIAQVRDAADLTCLLSVFQYYGLQREMQATLTQLKAVLLED